MVSCLTRFCQGHDFFNIPASLEFGTVPEKVGLIRVLCYFFHFLIFKFFICQSTVLSHSHVMMSFWRNIEPKHSGPYQATVQVQFKYSTTIKSHGAAQGTYLGKKCEPGTTTSLIISPLKYRDKTVYTPRAGSRGKSK